MRGIGRLGLGIRSTVMPVPCGAGQALGCEALRRRFAFSRTRARRPSRLRIRPRARERSAAPPATSRCRGSGRTNAPRFPGELLEIWNVGRGCPGFKCRQVQRLRAVLSWYIAASAIASASVDDAAEPMVARPIDTPTWSLRSDAMIGVERAWRSLLETASASSSVEGSGSSTASSSPPRRATVSWERGLGRAGGEFHSRSTGVQRTDRRRSATPTSAPAVVSRGYNNGIGENTRAAGDGNDRGRRAHVARSPPVLHELWASRRRRAGRFARAATSVPWARPESAAILTGA